MKRLGEIPEALRNYDKEKLVRFADRHNLNSWFEVWMKLTDVVLIRSIGLSTGDLPDKMYHDNFDAGVTPREMARFVLEEEAPFVLEGVE